MAVQSWMQTWTAVLTQPSEATFDAERRKPHATLSTAIVWLLLNALITLPLNWLGRRIDEHFAAGLVDMQGILAQRGINPQLWQQFVGDLFPQQAGLTCGRAVWAVFGGLATTFLFVGLLHGVAHMVDGAGDYRRYTYLIVAISVPINVLGELLGLVPLLGGCLATLLFLYQVVLAWFATRVEQRLSPGKALVVVLSPIGAVVIIFACVFVLSFRTI